MGLSLGMTLIGDVPDGSFAVADTLQGVRVVQDGLEESGRGREGSTREAVTLRVVLRSTLSLHGGTTRNHLRRR